jgi:hypothetical protein
MSGERLRVTTASFLCSSARGASDQAQAGVLALVALVVLLAACSSDNGRTPLDINVTLTSQETVLHQAGMEDEVIYGWNRLTGAAEVEGEEAQVELLGSVDYREGSGTFSGFVTVTFGDGSAFGVRLTDGRTEAATDTTNARFESGLDVVNGSGRYAGVSGDGEFDGSRNDELGGVVEARFRLEIDLP